MSIKFKTFIISILLPILVLIYSIFTKNYVTAFNSLLTILCLTILFIICKKFSIIKNVNYYSVMIFILLSFFVGRTLKGYALIPYWDKLLHFSSGFIIANIGSSVYSRFKDHSSNDCLYRIFVFSFAVAAAGLWEIYEFSIDNLLGTNAQNNSLTDTMQDMIAGSISALISIIFKIK